MNKIPVVINGIISKFQGRLLEWVGMEVGILVLE
jgi:hypothetical protein